MSQFKSVGVKNKVENVKTCKEKCFSFAKLFLRRYFIVFSTCDVTSQYFCSSVNFVSTSTPLSICLLLLGLFHPLLHFIYRETIKRNGLRPLLRTEWMVRPRIIGNICNILRHTTIPTQ